MSTKSAYTPPSFIALVFQNGLENRNIDAKRLKTAMIPLHCAEIWWAATVISEFTRLEFVQQASIRIRVNLTTFTRGRHRSALRGSLLGFVTLLFARPGGLHASLCNMFTVLHNTFCLLFFSVKNSYTLVVL